LTHGPPERPRVEVVVQRQLLRHHPFLSLTVVLIAAFFS